MPEKLVPRILLFAAILLEVAGITSMKLSRGFSEPLPSLAVPIFYVCSAAAVILALKRLDLSVTYAIWSGVGMALAAMIGIAYFREPPTFSRWPPSRSSSLASSGSRSQRGRATDLPPTSR